MNHEASSAAWTAALRKAGVLTHHDRAEDSLDLATTTRKYLVRIGMFHAQPAEPFFGSMELSWEWGPLLSARAITTEEDVLVELFGRDDAADLTTERPWLRVDFKLHGKLGTDTPLRLPSPETWRAWVATVADHVGPALSPEGGQRLAREGVIHSWLGRPEAQVRCSPSGDLGLLGVALEGWQAVDLPRQLDDRDQPPDEEPEAQLEAMAACFAAGLAAWTKSLKALLPRGGTLP